MKCVECKKEFENEENIIVVGNGIFDKPSNEAEIFVENAYHEKCFTLHFMIGREVK